MCVTQREPMNVDIRVLLLSPEATDKITQTVRSQTHKRAETFSAYHTLKCSLTGISYITHRVTFISIFARNFIRNQ